MPRIIALSGGIGSGKSTVARVLKTWGFAVYDCDNRAKLIMDEDAEIKQRLIEDISPCIIVNGEIDRAALSEIVFNDKEKLRRLNAIVHAAVRADMKHWTDKFASGDTVFVETAILYTSGLAADVDEELRVTAPKELRIARVQQRSNLSRCNIEARIASQSLDEHPATPLRKLTIIENAHTTPLLPQLSTYLKTLNF